MFPPLSDQSTTMLSLKEFCGSKATRLVPVSFDAFSSMPLEVEPPLTQLWMSPVGRVKAIVFPAPGAVADEVGVVAKSPPAVVQLWVPSYLFQVTLELNPRVSP